jgi:HAE1 family hydrophobic/amphiphilic exporter-1
MRLKESRRSELADIMDSEIVLPNGRRVRVDAIAEVIQDLGPLDIERKDQERMVKVEVDYFGRSIGDVVSSIQAGIAKRSSCRMPRTSRTAAWLKSRPKRLLTSSA